eukprot:764784-Hanusia_phi.AAC.2
MSHLYRLQIPCFQTLTGHNGAKAARKGKSHALLQDLSPAVPLMLTEGAYVLGVREDHDWTVSGGMTRLGREQERMAISGCGDTSATRFNARPPS